MNDRQSFFSWTRTMKRWHNGIGNHHQRWFKLKKILYIYFKCCFLFIIVCDFLCVYLLILLCYLIFTLIEYKLVLVWGWLIWCVVLNSSKFRHAGYDPFLTCRSCRKAGNAVPKGATFSCLEAVNEMIIDGVEALLKKVVNHITHGLVLAFTITMEQVGHIQSHGDIPEHFPIPEWPKSKSRKFDWGIGVADIDMCARVKDVGIHIKILV